jgi:hypothetical protein
MSERRWAVFLALSVVALVLLTLARCAAPAVDPATVTPTRTPAPVITIIPASPTVYVAPTVTPTIVREVILDQPLRPTATSLPAVIVLPTEPPTVTPKPEKSPVQRGMSDERTTARV